MRLAEDRRGRVPFALLGVLLLVGSATFAAALAGREPVDVNSRVGEVEHEVLATTRTALVMAVERAGRAAARNPVVEPANTSYGRVLSEATPYRDAFAVRIYSRALAALDGIEVRRGDVVGSVSLPEVDSPESLRRAKRRVTVEATNRTGVNVTVSNVTVTVRRGDGVVERRTVSPTVTVRTPALWLHRRVAAYEALLNAGPGERGFGRRLTTKLYALTWVRGYAQYGGAPIANVLANRHVALAANGAALDLQRAVFGRSDGRGRAAQDRAAVAVGLTDLLAAGSEGAAGWTDTVLGDATPGGAGGSGPAIPVPTAVETATANTTVGVNRTADRAFRDLLRGRNGPSLANVLGEVYEADVRLASRTRVLADRVVRREVAPEGWSLVATERQNETRHTTVDAESVTDAGEHAFETYAWRVTTTTETTRTWERGNETRETVTVRAVTRRVVVSVVGRHAATPHAPRRPVVGAHTPGGPLGGQNFAGVADIARERLVRDRGGPSSLRERALNGTLDTDPVSVRVTRPAGLRDRVYRDLVALRERVRNASVTVARGALLDANPAGLLAERVASQRATLHGAPSEYPSLAAKARVAARGAFLAALQRRLADRREAGADARSRLDEVLADAGVHEPTPIGSLLRGLDPGTAPTTNVVAVRGAPPYLTVSAVAPADVEGVTERTHPLAVRNVNLFTVPYGDAAGRIADAVSDRSGDRVRLHAAATALRAANRTLAVRHDETLAERRWRLRRRVTAATEAVRTEMVTDLAGSPAVPRPAATRAVAEAFERWDSTHARALAVANGTMSGAVRRAVGDGIGDFEARDRRALAARLALNGSRSEATVARAAVAATANRTRALGEEFLSTVAERGLKRVGTAAGRRLGRSLATVPAGLPVAPVPGYWAATVNAWRVTVRGQYQRFTVSATAGSPHPAPTVRYRRTAETVAFDVNGDGEPETLGRNEPVSFAVTTSVVVAVPPGKSGVGDVDGTADERSPGWPDPGPTAQRQGL